MIWKLRRKSCHNKDVSRTDWRGFTRYPRSQVPQRSSVAQIKRLPVAIALLVFSAFCSQAAWAHEISAETVDRFQATLIPVDPCINGCAPYTKPWHLDAIGAYDAWDVTTGASSTLIAVVDNGIDDQHPDLIGRVKRIPGCGLGVDQSSDSSHGTFIAGLIGATANNSSGTAGLDWNAELLDVRVMTGSQGRTSDIAAGIECAAVNGADIITLSFVQQGTTLSPALQNAISKAQELGALVVAAAGNDGYNRLRFPAAAAGVLSVGAINQSLQITPFSTRGDWVKIMAPGEDLLSLGSGVSNGVRTGQGTSFAAPLVAASAALIKDRFPYFDAGQITRQLLRTADQAVSAVDGSSFRILNAEQAVRQPYRSHWQVTASGRVIALGESEHQGDLSQIALSHRVVAIAANASGLGYWIAQSNGQVEAFGDALKLDDLAEVNLNNPIVDMAATASGNGYWLVASDGGIFSFGDAQFHGSTGALKLNQPIAAALQTQSGYDLVAEDGGVFNFSSPFIGSGASSSLKAAVVDATRRVGQW